MDFKPFGAFQFGKKYLPFDVYGNNSSNSNKRKGEIHPEINLSLILIFLWTLLL